MMEDPTRGTPRSGPDPDAGDDGEDAATHHGRPLDIHPDSPLADVIDVYTASDRAQLAALAATAAAFLTETVDHLHRINPHPGSPYAHATIAETTHRLESGDDDEPPLPGFPRYQSIMTMRGWVHEAAHIEDIIEFTTLLGTTSARTYAHIIAAMTLVHGLPRFHQRCLDGDFTIEHVFVATRACQDLSFTHLETIDEYLATRRADITIETFRRSLTVQISIIEPDEDRLETAATRRHVSLATTPEGVAYLTLTGPSPELKAYYLRISAFARAIRAGNLAPFADQLPDGAVSDDDRSIAALMFDIATRTVPQLDLQITTTDTTTGEIWTESLPLDFDDEPTPGSIIDTITATAAEVISGDDDAADGVDAVAGGVGVATDVADHAANCAGDVAGAAGETTTNTPECVGGTDRDAAADGDGGEDSDEHGVEDPRIWVRLVLPTHGQWLSEQAKMIATVPFLTLTNDTELPGMYSDGSPVPVDAARRIAGHSKTWTRILTDPATGTPIDARARTYKIPASIRQTLITQWQGCSAPGCTRRAETSEIDHIIPFDHARPESGGLTVFGNVHPVCKADHQAKTERKYFVRMTSDGAIEYTFPHKITATVAPGDNPVNTAHARLMATIESTGFSPRLDFDVDVPTPTHPSETQPPRTHAVGSANQAKPTTSADATGRQASSYNEKRPPGGRGTGLRLPYRHLLSEASTSPDPDAGPGPESGINSDSGAERAPEAENNPRADGNGPHLEGKSPTASGHSRDHQAEEPAPYPNPDWDTRLDDSFWDSDDPPPF